MTQELQAVAKGRAPGGASARLRRYARLRAAERALMTCGRFQESLAMAQAARDVAARMRAGLEGVSAGATGAPSPERELAALDAALADYSRSLRQTLARTPVADLRASLPGAALLYREEVEALLDLCLEDRASAFENLDRIDYLMTLLSSRMQNAAQSVIADAAKASPRLSALSAAVQRKLGDTGREPAEEIHSAAQAVVDMDDLGETVERMRVFKHSLDLRFFLPDVLRAVVDYNAAIANQLQALLDQERTMDKEFEAGLSRP